MTVVYKGGDKTFKVGEILWAKRELIDAIVERALLDQTEAYVDMIIDGQADMSRNAINETLRGVKDSAGDFLNDMIGDLKHEVERRLQAAQYGAAVTGLKFDLAGEVTDIEVDVSVSFSE
jgi:hypothetical protein